MNLRRERLTADQLERQRAHDLSWAEAQRTLAAPEFRAYREQSLCRLETKESAPLVTREEFLA